MLSRGLQPKRRAPVYHCKERLGLPTQLILGTWTSNHPIVISYTERYVPAFIHTECLMFAQEVSVTRLSHRLSLVRHRKSCDLSHPPVMIPSRRSRRHEQTGRRCRGITRDGEVRRPVHDYHGEERHEVSLALSSGSVGETELISCNLAHNLFQIALQVCAQDLTSSPRGRISGLLLAICSAMGNPLTFRSFATLHAVFFRSSWPPPKRLIGVGNSRVNGRSRGHGNGSRSYAVLGLLGLTVRDSRNQEEC